MGLLLKKAQEKTSRNYFKPKQPGEGIEGAILAINRGVGQFFSTEYVIKAEDGQVWIVSAAKNSILAKKIADDPPEVGDSMAVLYLGIPNGKKYKNWSVVVEHVNTLAKEEPGNDGTPSDLPF
jgi:hypothetical protein